MSPSLQSPPCQRGCREAAWGFPFPEIIHGALFFLCMGGTPGRLETARWGHRALQQIECTFGYAAGAHTVRPRAAEVVGPYGKTGSSP